MVHAYVERALAAGVRRLDFLRGDEPLQVRVGRGDEPIQRLLVRRTERLTMSAAPMPLGSLPRRPFERPSARRRPPHPRRRGPRDRHERRRPGAPLLARHPDGPEPLRRLGRVAARRGAPSASSSGPGSRSWSSTSRTTRSPSARWPRIWRSVRPDVIHAHMYRAEIVGTKRGHRPRARRATAGPTSSPPSIRAASVRRRTARTLARADAVHRPAHRRVDGDRARRSPTRVARRSPVRLIYNGVDLAALRPPGAVLHAARGVRHGAGLADRGRRRPAGAREGPSHAARGLAVGPPARSRTPTS